MNLQKGSDKNMYLQLTQRNYDYLINIIENNPSTTVEMEINKIIDDYIENKNK